MEQSKYALAYNSGVSAISAVLSLLKQGEHILLIEGINSETLTYVSKIFGPQTGIEWSLVDFRDVEKSK